MMLGVQADVGKDFPYQGFDSRVVRVFLKYFYCLMNCLPLERVILSTPFPLQADRQVEKNG